MGAIGVTALDPTVRGSRDVALLLETSPIGMVPVIRNAAFHRRRMRQLAAAFAAVAIGVPTLYFAAHIFFH